MDNVKVKMSDGALEIEWISDNGYERAIITKWSDESFTVNRKFYEHKDEIKQAFNLFIDSIRTYE
jgi:hypothetical protein